MLPAINDARLSLTISNSSSSELTLGWMLGMALVGVPVVLVYQAWAYKQFSGKVVVDEESY
jgi:cytochrome d ubiquinol oxidase subunit II